MPLAVRRSSRKPRRSSRNPRRSSRNPRRSSRNPRRSSRRYGRQCESADVEPQPNGKFKLKLPKGTTCTVTGFATKDKQFVHSRFGDKYEASRDEYTARGNKVKTVGLPEKTLNLATGLFNISSAKEKKTPKTSKTKTPKTKSKEKTEPNTPATSPMQPRALDLSKVETPMEDALARESIRKEFEEETYEEDT